MRLTRGGWHVLALAVAVVMAAAMPFAIVWRMTLACSEDLAAEEAEVHSDHRFTADDIGGIGDYIGVHWALDRLGDCSSGRPPEALVYRALFELDAPSVQTLLWDHTWLPATPVTADGPAGENAIGSALLAYVPAGAEWSMAAALDMADLGAYTGSLFLDAEHALAYARFW
ncbi:hypothetical protein AB0I28_04595 [Phytomonospora sp. NPDC050363]|uniref:hypothetical protein n=1 Tax=Phytomonospora sp. NPDC050363 TaxID=3155642 RepID=UPI0033F8F158